MTGFWFLDDIGRLRRERQAIEELAERAEWLRDVSWHLKAGLTVDAVIHSHDRDYPVRMTYPALFPSVPPAVKPQIPTDRWSQHQYSDGTLCLEWGPDTWHPAVLGAHVLESAYKLFDIENAENPREPRRAPSRHDLSVGQDLRRHTTRFLLTSNLAEYLSGLADGDSGMAEFYRHFQAESCLAVVQSIKVDGRDTWTDPWVPSTLREPAESPLLRQAVLFRLPVDTDQVRRFRTVAELDILLRRSEVETLSEAQDRLRPEHFGVSAIIIDRQGEVHFLLRGGAADTEFQKVGIVLPGPQSRTSRNPVEFEALRAKRAGIVGAGSIGSKLALSLARMGVGSFLLVDQDLFLPENVVRHALTLHNVGEHKAHAVAHLLRQISPEITVDTSLLHVTGQESNTSIAMVTRKLAECDVLVDATGDPRVFNILATAATLKKKPFTWAEVFAGGIGGLVARARPEFDPSPHVMRTAFHKYTAEHPYEGLVSETDYSTIDDSGAVVTASDADVSVIAAHAAQLAVDSLLHREPSAFPHSLYLVGLKRDWVFKAPFHTIALPTNHLRTSELEGTSGSGELTEETIAFLAGLLEDGNASSSAS